MTTRHRVADTDAFDDPGRKIIELDGLSIGVFKVDGKFHAMLNECAHQGGPLCKGQVRNELEAEDTEPGKHLEEDFSGDKTVACPWHGYTYKLETGEHIGDSDIVIETFDVVVEDETVFVEL